MFCVPALMKAGRANLGMSAQGDVLTLSVNTVYSVVFSEGYGYCALEICLEMPHSVMIALTLERAAMRATVLFDDNVVYCKVCTF